MNLGFGPNRKSPELARLLSVIPGLGHIYTREYFIGIVGLTIALLIMIMIPLNWIFLFAYIVLIIWSARDASRVTAAYNARKAAEEEFSAEKRTKDKFVELIRNEKNKM
jgi:hypothetical protein